MPASKPDPAVQQLPPIDRLLTRPDADPLPTPLDPKSPEAQGFPADPKAMPVDGQDGVLDDGTKPGDLGRSV
jgi:hypothetical protein